MTYKTMKKLILNANAQYENGYWDAYEYNVYKATQQNKLDVFYAKNRITYEQYKELTELWLEVSVN